MRTRVAAILALLALAATAHAEPFRLAHTILNPAPAAGDEFGRAVALVGGNVLVGAPDDDAAGTDAGAAYLFDGTTGELLRTFLSPNARANDLFGGSVAALGGNVLIGARGDDGSSPLNNFDAGAVYLFDGDPLSPTFGAVLRTFRKPNAAQGDVLGESVAALGGNVLATARGDDMGADNAGAAYLFNGVTGALLQTFSNPNPHSGDGLGTAIAAVGSNVLVSALSDDTDGTDTGIAYLFDGATGSVLQTFHNPTPGAAAPRFFGYAVAALGSNALVSNPEDDTGATDAGAVYLFDSSTGAMLRTFLSPTSPAGENFGGSVAAVGANLLVGATGSNVPLSGAGAAYLLDGASGAVLRSFFSPVPTINENFGRPLAATTKRIVFGVEANDTGADNAGLVYVFDRCGDGLVDPDEECDDGGAQGCDGCSATCTVEPGWRCAGEPSVCTTMFCGNGVLDPGEQCDDGNNLNGDGCDASCMTEALPATPTAAQTPAPTPTPLGGPPIFNADARHCEATLAAKARAFAATEHMHLQKCLDRVLKDAADGKSTAGASAACAKALDLADPGSILARVRARALAQIAAKCAGVAPADLNRPCADDASTMAETAACVLVQHAARVEQMVAAEYRDACTMLAAAGLEAAYPHVCSGL